jgi:hypothetical protein
VLVLVLLPPPLLLLLLLLLLAPRARPAQHTRGQQRQLSTACAVW